MVLQISKFKVKRQYLAWASLLCYHTAERIWRESSRVVLKSLPTLTLQPTLDIMVWIHVCSGALSPKPPRKTLTTPTLAILTQNFPVHHFPTFPSMILCFWSSHFIELSCLRTFALAVLPSYKLFPEKATGLVSIKNIGQEARKIASG